MIFKGISLKKCNLNDNIFSNLLKNYDISDNTVFL